MYLLSLKLKRGGVHGHGSRGVLCGVSRACVHAWCAGDHDVEGHDGVHGDQGCRVCEGICCHACEGNCCHACGDDHEGACGSLARGARACGGDEVKGVRSDREEVVREEQESPGPSSVAADPEPRPARYQSEDYLA